MYKEIIGLRIKERRIEVGYTQIDLAAITNIDQGKLSKIENGKTYPNIEELGRIAKQLNISTDELLGVVIEREPATKKAN